MEYNSTTYVSLLNQLDTKCNPANIIAYLRRFVIIIYNADLDDKYGQPMQWIGVYVALASLGCILAMVADLLHGLRSRKLWFPCKYFTINAFSLAVIAVAMKLPVDLSASMPGVVDQVAKLGSVAFMCTMMANLLPCLATMDGKVMLSNITGLGVPVITLVVNVCIQIHTGVVSCSYCQAPINTTNNIPERFFSGLYPDNLDVIGGVPYSSIATIYVTMLLVLLIIHVSSSLAILSSKQIIELKYQKAHETASTFLQQSTEDQLLTVEKLKQHVSNYWIMAGSGSPQLIIGCFATTTASGVICALTTTLHTLTMAWTVSHFRDYGSAYDWSTQLILVVQFIGVLIGSVAPLSRCFASFSFKLNIESFKVFKVQSYWIQKLSDWKDQSIPFPFRTHKRTVMVMNLKSLILNVSIKLQKGVVVVCKIIAFIPFFFMICIFYFVGCLKWLLQATACSSGERADNNDTKSPYVLQLEDEMELAKGTLEGLSISFNRVIQNGEKKQPKNLMELINTKSTTDFQGVRSLANNDHQVKCSLAPQVEYRDCWSLAVVTLATIAVTLRNIKKVEVGSLLLSVREGLDYVTLVEKNLNATEDYVSIQKAAVSLWQEVDVSHQWLGIKLGVIASQVTTSASQDDATLQIVQLFSKNANKKISELDVGSTNSDSKFTYICANSMARITDTVIKESHKKSFDELISSRIADIIAACLTNLPQVIAMKCHIREIEKREACVKGAAKLLGETKMIIETLQDPSRHVSSMQPDNLPFIDKWQACLSEP